MEPTKSKLDTFFSTVNQLIGKGELKRGKSFKIVEESNGKVLYIDTEAVYAAYAGVLGLKAVRLMDIRHLLQNAPFFVKYAKVVNFRWEEKLSDTACINYTKNISAPMLCYDTLKEKYNIDFERYSLEEFEAAILAKGIPVENIDEIKLKGKFVSMAIGYINNQKYTWNTEGKCFMKSGTPNQRYNLIFE